SDLITISRYWHGSNLMAGCSTARRASSRRNLANPSLVLVARICWKIVPLLKSCILAVRQLPGERCEFYRRIDCLSRGWTKNIREYFRPPGLVECRGTAPPFDSGRLQHLRNRVDGQAHYVEVISMNL